MKTLEFLYQLSEENLKEELEKVFFERFGKSEQNIVFAVSPARVNLIGEHIDYNGGMVFPTAINIYMYILLRPRKDEKIIYDALLFDKQYEFSVNDKFVFNSKNSYANYLNGMLKFLKEAGLKLNTGFEVLIFSKIPQASGVSSSAALEIGFGVAVSEAFNFKIDGITLAKIGQKVENEFLNLKSGIMDQFIIAMSKADTAMLLNTANLEHEYIPFSFSDYKLIVMNSCKPRELVASKYNERKTECEQGLSTLQKKIKINHLCDLEIKDYKKYENYIISECGEIIHKRITHCITENNRVKMSVKALKENDLKTFCELMKQSHLSLKDNYEVTGLELDTLYFAALKQTGCLGARMTGAGFGGCAIAIVQADSYKQFCKNVNEEYKNKTGLSAGFYDCMPSDGARVI
ncbi:MAG: galactokinase [Treponema sp.]|nr:MAG: galactokinase [Treponema sp.]